MRLFSPAWLEKHYSKVMIGAIIIYVLPFVILIGLAVSIVIFPPPPQSFDFNEMANDVTKIEMVEWKDSFDPTAYNLIKIIAIDDEIVLLNELSQLAYQQTLNVFLDVQGKCFRITLENKTVNYVCSSGVAKFSLNEVENGKTLGMSVNNDIYSDLWIKYLSR